MPPDTTLAPLKPGRRFQPQPAMAWCDECSWHRSGDQIPMEDAVSRHAAAKSHQARVLTAAEVIFTPAEASR